MDNMIMWSPGVSLEEIEKQVILKAFRFYRGNKTSTASALGIAIRTLDNKLEKYEQDGLEQKQRDDELNARNADFLHRQRGPTQSINASDEERELQRTKAGIKTSEQASTGLRMESAPKVPTQQPVPMSEREKVQSVSSQPTASGGSRPRR